MWKLDRCTLIVTYGDGDYCFKFSYLNHSCYHFGLFADFLSHTDHSTVGDNLPPKAILCSVAHALPFTHSVLFHSGIAALLSNK